MKKRKVLPALSLIISIGLYAQNSIAYSATGDFRNLQDAVENVQVKMHNAALENVQDVIDREAANWVLRNANWGFVLYDPVEGQVIASHNGHQPLKPASTTKLLTTEMAYNLFGPKYKWTTQLEYSGTIDENGALSGDLFIIGSGDPSMGVNQTGAYSYWAMAEDFKSALKTAGIKRINGNIVIETAIFPPNQSKMVLPENIVWREHNNYYLPVGNVGELTVNGSKVIRDQLPGFKVVKYFYVSPETGEVTFTPIYEGSSSLGGTLPPAPAYLADLFRKSLLKSGIHVGSILTRTSDPDPEPRIRLTAINSPTLEDIAFFTNQTSNNRLAENFLKLSGFYKVGDFSVEGGKQGLFKHLKKNGFDFDGLEFIDGSGLSHNHRITPIAQVKFLTRLMKEPYYKSFINTLPVAGTSGTLRTMFVNDEGTDHIFAKTGTLNKVKTLAGYIQTKSGKTLTFSLLINNYNGSVAQVKKEMENLLLPALDL